MLTPAVPAQVRTRRFQLGIGGRLILLHVLTLCTLTVLLGAIEVAFLQRTVREELGQRALTTSRLVARMPLVVAGASAGTQNAELNAFVNDLRAQVGADFIVVGDRKGIRLAHPRPDRLGRPMEGGDNAEPLAGREIVSVAFGSLGQSVRGKVPVRDASGRVVGVVSTGFLMPRVRALAMEAGRTLLPWFLLALALGSAAAVVVARLLKRAILNLEPEQISTLVSQQRGVLAALPEGVLAVNGDGLITLANARAADLLELRVTDLPHPVVSVWPQLAGAAGTPSGSTHNLDLQLRDLPVLVNIEPLAGGGYVASIRDRREAIALAEELTQVRGFVDVLRAQTHEYVNRLHIISGLLQLDRPAEALRVIRQEIEADAQLRELLRDIRSPQLVALLVGKRERAQELGVEFRVEPGSSLSARWSRVTDALVLAVGNLTENAFEAFRGQPGTVRVLIGEDPEGVQIEVLDDGPGVLPEITHRVFEQGVSSKGQGRGYGLAGVRRRIEGLGGTVLHFRRGGWTVFQVNLPAGAAPDDRTGVEE